jgi:hypothetical protein
MHALRKHSVAMSFAGEIVRAKIRRAGAVVGRIRACYRAPACRCWARDENRSLTLRKGLNPFRGELLKEGTKVTAKVVDGKVGFEINGGPPGGTFAFTCPG